MKQLGKYFFAIFGSISSFAGFIFSLLSHSYGKVLFLAVSLIFGLKWAIDATDENMGEAMLSVQATPLMIDMNGKDYISAACIDEQRIYLQSIVLDRKSKKNRLSLLADGTNEQTELEGLSRSELYDFSHKGFEICAVQHYVSIGKLSVSLIEAARVPVSMTIPYELFKRQISKTENTTKLQCSDYVDVIATVCPKVVAGYIEKQLEGDSRTMAGLSLD